MKAIVVYQPWATLIALGEKEIETRPCPPNGPMRPEGVRGLPGCSLERGERIAIVAGAVPSHYFDGPEAWNRLAEAIGWDAPCGSGRDLWGAMRGGGGISGSGLTALGAVVCTAVVADALPIVDPDRPWNPYDTGGCLFPEGDWMLTYSCGDVSDESAAQFDKDRPFGDFSPGRWGWLLTDVVSTAPVPVKGRQGVFDIGEVGS